MERLDCKTTVKTDVNESTYITTFKKFLDENTINLSQTKETVTLFFSFDLVNSSKYKMYSCNWVVHIKKLLKLIAKSVNNKIENSSLWRCIGDELIFTVNITSQKELCDIIQNIYNIMYNINNDIKDGKSFSDNIQQNEFSLERLMLGVKATAWISIIKQQKERYGNNYNLDDNIQYMFFTGKEGSPGLVEFQGKDIDTGFRIAKHNSCQRRLTLSLELADILAKDAGVSRKIHIISYKKLKGVFNSRLYPVIWYHDEYISGCSLEESFYYDEDENNEIVHDFFKENNKLIILKDKKTTREKLEKIVKDINLSEKINLIISTMEKTTKMTYKTNSYLEIHCVAVCYDEMTNSVLILKRKSTDEHYPNGWDFGCAKMIVGKSFKDQLIASYKKLLNINVSILEPFKEFNAGKEDNIIPGIRFFAKIDSSESINLCKDSKYDDFKLVKISDFKDLYSDKVIDEVEFLECIELLKQKFGGDQ